MMTNEQATATPSPNAPGTTTPGTTTPGTTTSGAPGTTGFPGSTGAPDDLTAQAAPKKPAYLKTGARDKVYVDYRAVDDLRRLMTPNGKIYSRKRLGVSAREQRMIAQAIKRARYMGLLPYTNATL